MSCQKIITIFLSSTCLGSIYLISPILAQIVPDNTLGSETSLITPNAKVKNTPADFIEGGAIRDNNLFHSFSEFNIPDGNNVYFANPEGVTNILTRITGNSVSEILGTLGVDGTANLFLLNPNGIVFGENASLDVNGSFLATTAHSYIFENDFAYSASSPNLPTLLTVNIPVGLQFGQTAYPIKIQTQSLDVNEFFTPQGIGVRADENITLIGGDLELTAGYISSPNSKINLGSVAPHSLVQIIPTEDDWSLDYDNVHSFQNISLTEGSAISSSGDNSGSINIQAQKLSIREDSRIDADNHGNDDGKHLSIRTTEMVEINGEEEDNLFSFSWLSTDVYGSGKGANLEIYTKTLQLINLGLISTITLDSGDAGDITINADAVMIDNYGYIDSDSYGLGNAGDIRINANLMDLNGESVITSSANDIGKGGGYSSRGRSSYYFRIWIY